VPELAELCQRRQERWSALRRRVAQSSLLELGEASGLRLTDEERSIASRVLDADEVDELATIEQAIADHPALPLVRKHIMSATAVHEAQHVLDQAAGLPVPASLSDIDDGALAEAAAAETSGYLAQIAHAPAAARSSLARIRQLEQDAELRGGPEQLAASLILEELAATDPSNPESLAHAARQLWKQLFGRELVPLVALD